MEIIGVFMKRGPIPAQNKTVADCDDRPVRWNLDVLRERVTAVTQALRCET
jgi:hypothetical protein